MRCATVASLGHWRIRHARVAAPAVRTTDSFTTVTVLVIGARRSANGVSGDLVAAGVSPRVVGAEPERSRH